MPQAYGPNVNGYAGYAYPILSPPKPKPAVKPVNVFSDDGSFLDRIRRSMKEEDEKRKREEDLERKRNFDNRFRNRGKRPLPATDSTSAKPPTKKQRSDNTSVKTEYQKLVEDHSKRNLKGDGAGGHTLTR
ncbi:uncharacterized protein BT62DRAFT_1076710 [Guyanagaster necrorhizus]|uniref:Uncharacterized protein n=1 Tax=Guyanagaster necrorhizus TaxID=856835 RepID=A0A9P8AS58_9AGAR|nr:uncharacterized protein BT62DRAFT_1076710 [Guyanagaster necrorhizus MCA 3950]KAG7445626.1 hypothetical protein BT62DRAFT_1076710 [Guyanagaster necrorhizus MCA 3950]